MSEKSYVLAVISDIHFGAMKSEDLYNELDKGFLKCLKSLKVLDAVVITGDLFDNKISLNSQHAKYAFMFLKKLIDICVEKNAVCRIVKGTDFHDNKQLDALKFLYNSNIDIKVFDHVDSEELFPNVNVLYVPEEYVTDKDEYYKEHLNKKYDMIFGHGMVNEVAFVASKQESEVTMSRAPIFKSEELLNACRGPVFFGHIHKPQCIKERLYYVGSFSRWCFGETEPKGFMIVGYTPDTGKYNIEFIENKLAPSYDTMIVDYNSALYQHDEENQITYILNMVNNLDPNIRLRIIFNIPENYPNPLLLKTMINDIFSKHKEIKIIINDNNEEKKKKQEMENKIKTLLSTYDFIFDKGVSPEEKLTRYIKIKYNKEISVERMRNYLYQKINI